ncbi:MAG: hypothetical protein A2268_02440 [Candidatus Raymondbacteria bacterium RifOxyA12_full_50_37]|uniref:DNA-binding response regulator n=1 Tax=Candidatus Raymondbacteria bacterium RIFOXYD12_FULL_49_13 TaxID=1817890 RepID=A0A1F7F3D0_UNCRA|nr:MAG: hypothetical protein A2268_02440 [Candidatus Raymondbacteria bacterium RifOxyA12_full_50_37]OGJ89140.1 MAG: hypothetical protein A2248_11325 [Candidatus Raymondbacteria bacterium RIFOXYA2_FULL_49_16]OGJ96510.1 MAG: hypothetical protein A2350_05045 [Candidatus Raymondbacteria bacterium RifOxyB12_full_50_8]OGJ96622.1 MAG: hypothetical protein A2453_06440 [Candidatus Raymondbacteria bacterium RIFOXYC2_FULL_50_21]OGK01073.1 MAG: hypothetical protein A2519_16920 [Candidatus Raymondbacteria b
MISGVQPLVYIVDDDPSVRKSLCRLVRTSGYEAKAFASAEDFLACPRIESSSCLLLDISMPGMDGLALQETLNSISDRNVPIIFITGHADIPMSVKAMKAGAMDVLTKPFESQELLSAIEKVLKKETKDFPARIHKKEIQARIQFLTNRERDVFRLVITGMLNKQIAAELKIAEKTVKVHRHRVMEKMKAGSVAELVRFEQEAGLRRS